MKSCSLLGLLTATLIMLGPTQADASDSADLAKQILDATGVKGGLIVHIGCGDGKLTVALQGEGYLVHGLDADAENVQKARDCVRSAGCYGDVSIERLSGQSLPYVDNLANLVVMQDAECGIRDEEIMRVLAPGGVLLKTSPDTRNPIPDTSVRKPRPAEIDEWTHFLYDATNNAVADDSVVGPPRQLQWVGGPAWARSHDHLGSVSAAVSAGGRIFYIVDEAPIAAIVLEPQWNLVARDAFSGVILWQRPIPKWQWHLRGFRSGPSDLSRRLVAVGDRVYVTLGVDAPLSVLGAATGETIATYEGTDGTLEVLHDDGTLFIVAGDASDGEAVAKAERRGLTAVRPQRPAYLEQPPTKRIMAIDADSGKVMWKKSDADTTELMPTTLAVSNDRVFFQNADNVVCLDTKSGEEVWQAERTVSRSRPTWTAPTLVVYGDVVLSGDRAVAEKKTVDQTTDRTVEWIVSSAGGQAPVGELIAFSAKTGERLWSGKCRECYNAPVDVLVADGLVWTGELVRANEPGVTEGRDPETGEIKRTRPSDQEFFQAGMGHGRCYRNKATNQYLVLGRSGVEFIDVATGEGIANHWTRGTCQYGVIPSNGLLYVPPHSCACFIRSKLNGFNCFAPKRESKSEEVEESKSTAETRLEKGTAYGQIGNRQSPIEDPHDWPTYRRDGARSGCTSGSVSTDVKPAWQQELGGRLSSVVVAGGKVFVAQIDAHTVHALDAADGKPAWSYTVAGRVDSPPTIWQGRVLFGAADGYVYCLRASDGALAWRFRAAPEEQRIVAYGQLESAWPVHGSVLVRDGVVYCTAGRSSYLDGSIRLCRLKATTGKLLSETVIDHRDPETGYQRKGSVRGTNMPGALPDVLSCDAESIYMRHSRFDLEGQPQTPDVAHLFSSAGFLDDTWWHRTYWMVGTMMATNYGGWANAGSRAPAGRLLALDDSTVYGFGRNQYIHHGAHVGIDGATVFHFRPDRDSDRRFTHYRLFAADRNPRPVAQAPRQPAPKKKRAKPAPPRRSFRWEQRLPVLARAMVVTGDTIFVAGPPDVFEADDPAAALDGKKGGVLVAVSTSGGQIAADCKLGSPPVFDGLAAAGGRLYVATVDGRVLCLSD
ncbi:MAG: PQQ-binding-like beta-propeller repeat protein [Planctomycetes bacterium]|nr:PQQ-binding-like beta-propeller repeat protein [Planctomycetota bacterium]MBL7039366.1 PQQ-binding-like beta-propeller repeat protein [Pirellulaceae bacterium]